MDILKDPRDRKALLLGVIGTIIGFAIIEPLLTALGKAMLWAGEYMTEGFLNSIYRQAAKGLHEQFSFTMFTIMSTVFIGLYGGVFVSATARQIRSRRKSPKPRTVISDDALRAKLSRLTLAVQILSLIGTVFLLWSAATSFASYGLTTQFEQRLTVITPYLTSQELNVLRAKWALMDNRSDYDAIEREMKQVAAENRVTFPRR